MTRVTEDILDEFLVLAAQSGKEAAFEQLARRWHARLFGFARGILRSAEDAEDVMQESWLAIAQGLRRLQDPAKFRSWAHGIVSRKCVDLIRKRSSVPRTRSADAGDATAELNTESRPVADLRDALSRLRPQERAILSLFYLERTPVSQIAVTLGLKAGTVKSRLFEARQSLKRAMERMNS